MTTIKDLTPETAHRVVAAQLTGDGRHSDEIGGLYIDSADVDDAGIAITFLDEEGDETTLTMQMPKEDQHTDRRDESAVAPRRPTYLDPHPFVEPATRS